MIFFKFQKSLPPFSYNLPLVTLEGNICLRFLWYFFIFILQIFFERIQYLTFFCPALLFAGVYAVNKEKVIFKLKIEFFFLNQILLYPLDYTWTIYLWFKQVGNLVFDFGNDSWLCHLNVTEGTEFWAGSSFVSKQKILHNNNDKIFKC